MSDFGAYEGEMDNIARLSDRELDLLLEGKAPADDGSVDDVTAFVEEAAVFLQETPDEATAARHLAAIAAVAHEELSEPSVSPSRADRKAPSFRIRSKPVFRNPLSGLAGKMALVAVVVLAVFGGTAYAGGLPHPLQGAVADVADSLGLSLPGADDDSDDGAVGDVDEGALDDADDGTVDDQGDDYPDHEGTIEDDQGDDEQGANEDDQGDDDQGDQGANEDDQGDDDQGDQGANEDDQGDDDQGDQGANEDDEGSADEGDQGGDADQDGDSADQDGDSADQDGDSADQSDGDN